MARDMVTSSAYSMSLPAGTPVVGLRSFAALGLTVESHFAQGGGQPACCGFAFEGGAGGEDDFVDFAALDSGEEVGGAELVGAYSVERRERAVEDVVDAHVSAGALDAGNAGGLLNDADEALVADGAGAVGAGIDVGDVVADGAEAQAGLELADGVGEGGGVFVAGAQEVEGEALGAFGADAGELLEFVDEPGHGLGVTGHGFRVQGMGGREQGSGNREQGSESREQGLRD